MIDNRMGDLISKKLKISVFIVGYNESKLLANCLQSVKYADEILYFDLQSIDDSLMIAKQFTQNVFEIQKEEFVEIVHSKYIYKAKNDWIMIIDPDEVVDKALFEYLFDVFDSISQNDLYGAIQVPWKFYFKKTKLQGTPWGYNNSKILLVNKNKFEFRPIIHQGRIIKEGYKIFHIEDKKDRVVHHFWMLNVKSLFSKHLRYLKREGESNYKSGVKKPSLLRTFYSPFVQFYHSYITKKGYRDKFTGLLLSIFWAWYHTNVQINIRKFYLRREKVV